MNMSETPEKKKARLRYDNVFKTAWTDEVYYITPTSKFSLLTDIYIILPQHDLNFHYFSLFMTKIHTTVVTSL
jgi:hypothetical protein